AGDIAERGVRAHQHHHVRESMYHEAEIGLRSRFPLVLQPDAVDAAEIDLVESAGDGVEAGGEDDDIEFKLFLAGLDTLWRYALDRRFIDIDQLDIVAIIDLVIEGLERQPAGAEAVIPGNQLLRNPLVLHALANLPRNEVADGRVRLAVDEDVL